MIIAIPYCHHDAIQARRLLNWIGFMSNEHGECMRQATVLLCASRTAAAMQHHKPIQEAAQRAFGKVFVHVPKGEEERGWPISPNFMFREILEIVERHFQDDTLLLEPDCIPLKPEWYNAVITDYFSCGKVFMGARVEAPVVHCTGNAVYGRAWRKVAPRLVTATHEAWDTWAAGEMIPHTHWTTLIQHVFHNPVVTEQLLRKDAVLFHQDKGPRTFALLDQLHYGGRCAESDFSYNVRSVPMPEKYYYFENATREFEQNRFTFKAEPIGQIGGGAWYGVMKLADEGAQFALGILIANPRNGISEIPVEDYQKLKKNKQMTQHFRGGNDSQQQVMSSSPVEVQLAGDQPSVVVAGTSLSPSPEKVLADKVQGATSADDLVQLGEVKAQPVAPKSTKRIQ